ncbi:MAG: hypothetical protein EA398_06985 [Deltaproteobacteria bacterium]|nr:MAG: hypothetical protein EA398_06985 [Deltaproteobacteria bacterium]
MCNGAPGEDGEDGPQGPGGPIGDPGVPGDTICSGLPGLEIEEIDGLDQVLYRGFESDPVTVRTNLPAEREDQLSLAFVGSGARFADLGAGRFTVTGTQAGSTLAFGLVVTDGCTTAIGQAAFDVEVGRATVRFIHLADGVGSVNIRPEGGSNLVTGLGAFAATQQAVDAGEVTLEVVSGGDVVLSAGPVSLLPNDTVTVAVTLDDEGDPVAVLLEDDLSPLSDAEFDEEDRTNARLAVVHAAADVPPVGVLVGGVSVVGDDLAFGESSGGFEVFAAEAGTVELIAGGDTLEFVVPDGALSAGDIATVFATWRNEEVVLAVLFLTETGAPVALLQQDRPGRVSSAPNLGIEIPDAEGGTPGPWVESSIDVTDCPFAGRIEVTVTIDKERWAGDIAMELVYGARTYTFPRSGGSAAFGTRIVELPDTNPHLEQPATGTWTLRVRDTDTVTFSTGTLQQWGLDIQCLDEPQSAFVRFGHFIDGLGSVTFRDEEGGTTRTVSFGGISTPIRVNAAEQEQMELVVGEDVLTLDLDAVGGDEVLFVAIPDAAGDPAFFELPLDTVSQPLDAGDEEATLALVRFFHGVDGAGPVNVELADQPVVFGVEYGEYSIAADVPAVGGLLGLETGAGTLTYNATAFASPGDVVTFFVVPDADENVTLRRWVNFGSTTTALSPVDLDALGTLPEDFAATPEGELPPNWIGGGFSPFEVVEDETSPTGFAAASGLGPDDHNQESWMEVTIRTEEPGTVSWQWKVSSESCCDFLYFCANRSTCGRFVTGNDIRIAGEVDWTEASFDLPAGIHTLRWAYGKDGSVSTNQDTGWVTDVRFTPED